MNKLKKAIASIIIASLGMLTLVSCSSGGSDVSLKSIDESVTKTTDVSFLKKVDDEVLEQLYGIKKGDVEEYFGYYTPVNVKADEIIVLKAKDEKAAKELLGKVEQRVKNQEQAFERYLPEVYDQIKAHVLKQNGNYVFMVISPDVEKISKTIDESTK
ncbi:MAG: DUF4358 domain-containing protein [Clostridium sp.]|uniref:DUF4358 domain-containing protein n=1 Tax=Clostridium sp. TaxID=1506 RepID=UPI002FCC32A5